MGRCQELSFDTGMGGPMLALNGFPSKTVFFFSLSLSFWFLEPSGSPTPPFVKQLLFVGVFGQNTTPVTAPELPFRDPSEGESRAAPELKEAGGSGRTAPKGPRQKGRDGICESVKECPEERGVRRSGESFCLGWALEILEPGRSLLREGEGHKKS